MSVLDRIRAAATALLGREVAARAPEQLATYPDAIPTRRDEQPLAPGTTPDWNLELGRDRRLMCDRVRQLLRGNALARALVDRTTDAVCGTGYRLQMRTRKANGELDEDWNKQAEEIFNEWAMEGADYREISNLHELNSLHFRGFMSDGESGFVKLATGRLRGFESDELGDPAGYWRPGAVDGLMLDEQSRPKTYRIFKPSMNTIWADRRTSGDRLEVPARDVIFRARRSRLGQTRGETAFLGGFWPLDQIMKALEAITVGLRMSACLGLVIKTAQGFELPNEPDDSNQPRRTLRLTPGGVINLKPGEDVQQVTPTALTPQIEAHLKLLVRIASAAWGQTVEILLGDHGSLNLSSARANLLTAVRVWKGLQFSHCGVYSAELKWKLVEWMEDGRLAEKKDWSTHRWIKPKTLILDPLTDIQAELLEVDAGFKTLEEVAEERGWTLEDLAQALRRQLELFRELDLPRSSLTRDRLPEGEAAGAGEGQARARGARPQDIREVKRSIAAGWRAMQALAERPVETHVHNQVVVPERQVAVNVEPARAAPASVEVKNHFLMPETRVENQTLVNVDVDAQIKGPDKRVTILRDDQGKITGAIATEKPPARNRLKTRE